MVLNNDVAEEVVCTTSCLLSTTSVYLSHGEWERWQMGAGGGTTIGG